MLMPKSGLPHQFQGPAGQTRNGLERGKTTGPSNQEHNDRAEITIVPAEYKHILDLAPLLRAADRGECMMAGMTPHKALWRAWRGSMIACTGFVDGEIAAMWGMIGTPLGKVGNPWLLTSPTVEKVPRAFLEIGRYEVHRMLSLCPVLFGLVDPTYSKATRFLKFLGYSLGDPVGYGPHRELFLPFRMER